jgi:hypothetical protein
VWGEGSELDTVEDVDDDDASRFYTFEVAKTKEEEEGVRMRSGFTVSCCRFFDKS